MKPLVTSTHRVTYTCLVSCLLSYAELLREELKRDGLSFIPNEGGRAAVPASPWPATLLCAGKVRVKGQGSPRHPLGSVPALPEAHLSSLAPRARVPPPFSGPHPLLKHLPKTHPQPLHKYLLGPEMHSFPVRLQTIQQLSRFPPNSIPSSHLRALCSLKSVGSSWSSLCLNSTQRLSAVSSSLSEAPLSLRFPHTPYPGVICINTEVLPCAAGT